ncbi:MAG: hypothetical protein QM564_02790 [Bergeyella sp.]
MEKKQKQYIQYLLMLVMLISSQMLFADGSKDLYPNGKTGRRALLRSSTVATVNWPFANEGTHYVYAKAGEIITLASSAQTHGGSIKLYDPSGNIVVNNSTTGNIPNRTQEKNGPQLYGGSVTGRYTPIYYQVPTGNTAAVGIYKVEFISPSPNATVSTVSVNADSSWTQVTNGPTIAAWDVSVINDTNTAFISGRVYTNVLNLTNGTEDPNTSGFYGIFYVRTKDGYTYRVNNNGNNGLNFTFFVNNNGFIDATTGDAIYQSLNTTSNLGDQVHDPNTADTEKQHTHKMFYTLPATDLPTTATGAVPGGSTWLNTTVVEPEVSNILFTGAEGTAWQTSIKGGTIQFSAAVEGKYAITIESDATPAAFEPRTIRGTNVAGINTIYWDGKDGDGNSLPSGELPVKITVQLTGAEVHFPFFDVEYNRYGVIIELLNHTDLSAAAVSDVVYWNDTGISEPTTGSKPYYVNNSHLPPPDGISSTGLSSTDTNINNRHTWGIGGTGVEGLFGDVKSIDTWTFIKGEEETVETVLNVKIADLKISQMSADKNYVVSGDALNLTVKVKNDGPDDVTGAPFTFTLPEGFEGSQGTAVFSGNSCGTESITISYDETTKVYSSSLNLPSGCEVTYVFPVTVTSAASSGTSNAFKATILRPNDVTDPDATNPDPDIPPTDPYYECANNGLDGTCNNLDEMNIYFSTTEVCTESVDGNPFSWSYNNTGDPTAADDTQVEQTFTQPASDFGFILNIYGLDNSFNMTVNGTPLTNQEIQFQPIHTQNIRFKSDGALWQIDGIPPVWEMSGDDDLPVIQVKITPTGGVFFYGKRSDTSPLEELELFGGHVVNNITWNNNGTNVIVVGQTVDYITRMSGSGYGLNIVPCACYNDPAAGTGPDTKVGITLLKRAGADAPNEWPMVRKSGHIALESNTKGFVVTRMTTTQINAISAPQEGMMVYDTVDNCLKIYDGTSWSCYNEPACP